MLKSQIIVLRKRSTLYSVYDDLCCIMKQKKAENVRKSLKIESVTTCTERHFYNITLIQKNYRVLNLGIKVMPT